MTNKKADTAYDVASPQLDGRKLAYACLHYPLFVPEVGRYEPTLAGIKLDNHQGKVHDMTIVGNFVLIKDTNYRTKKPVEVWIPLTSFTHLVPA